MPAETIPTQVSPTPGPWKAAVGTLEISLFQRQAKVLALQLSFKAPLIFNPSQTLYLGTQFISEICSFDF